MAYVTRRKVGYFYDSLVANFYYDQGHPMKLHRMRMTHNLLLAYGLFDRMDVLCTPRASDRDMTRFHSDEYINFLKIVFPEIAAENLSPVCRFIVQEDCPVFDGLWEYCQIAAGGSLAGAARLNAGESSIAINWAGGLHHAKKSEASGFCYINDCVLAILELLKVHSRVLYVDIDIHHGDGVEEAFYTTDRVMTASFHKFGDYFPGTGDVVDIGIGKGKYYSANFPLRDGIDDDSYREIFAPVMTRIMDWYRPGAVVLQCGADSLSGDRLGCFNLSLVGHSQCVDFFKKYDVPLLLIGGGGYTIRNVARCWAYETSRAVGETLTDNIPYNENIEYFGPDYQLHIRPSNMENHNSRTYLNNVKMRVFEHLRHLPYAPSTPMMETPRTYVLNAQRQDADEEPDVRVKNNRAKLVVDYAGSDDDDDDQYVSSLRYAKRKGRRLNFPRRRYPTTAVVKNRPTIFSSGALSPGKFSDTTANGGFARTLAGIENGLPSKDPQDNRDLAKDSNATECPEREVSGEAGSEFAREARVDGDSSVKELRQSVIDAEFPLCKSNGTRERLDDSREVEKPENRRDVSAMGKTMMEPRFRESVTSKLMKKSENDASHDAMEIDAGSPQNDSPNFLVDPDMVVRSTELDGTTRNMLNERSHCEKENRVLSGANWEGTGKKGSVESIDDMGVRDEMVVGAVHCASGEITPSKEVKRGGLDGQRAKGTPGEHQPRFGDGIRVRSGAATTRRIRDREDISNNEENESRRQDATYSTTVGLRLEDNRSQRTGRNGGRRVDEADEENNAAKKNDAAIEEKSDATGKVSVCGIKLRGVKEATGSTNAADRSTPEDREGFDTGAVARVGLRCDEGGAGEKVSHDSSQELSATELRGGGGDAKGIERTVPKQMKQNGGDEVSRAGEHQQADNVLISSGSVQRNEAASPTAGGTGA